MMVERLLVGSGLVLLLSVKVEAIVPLAIFALTGTYILLRKPYK